LRREGVVADLIVAADCLMEFAGVTGVVTVGEIDDGVGGAEGVGVSDARVGVEPFGLHDLAGVLGGSGEFGGFYDGETKGIPVVEGDLVRQHGFDDVAGPEGAVDLAD
jgi:hypothetical protein